MGHSTGSRGWGNEEKLAEATEEEQPVRKAENQEAAAMWEPSEESLAMSMIGRGVGWSGVGAAGWGLETNRCFRSGEGIGSLDKSNFIVAQ